MSYRGSLRQCVTMAISTLQTTGHEEASILRCTPGKYYVLVLPPDYDSYHAKVASKELALVLCMSLHELRSVLKSEQVELFQQPPDKSSHPLEPGT